MSASGKIKSFDPSGSTYTRPQAIAGGTVTGYYNDGSNIAHGFLRSR